MGCTGSHSRGLGPAGRTHACTVGCHARLLLGVANLRLLNCAVNPWHSACAEALMLPLLAAGCERPQSNPCLRAARPASHLPQLLRLLPLPLCLTGHPHNCSAQGRGRPACQGSRACAAQAGSGAECCSSSCTGTRACPCGRCSTRRRHFGQRRLRRRDGQPQRCCGSSGWWQVGQAEA